MKKIQYILLLVYSIALFGCASITTGKYQSLSVSTGCNLKEVKDTNCTLSNDHGTWYVNSPGSVHIQKSYDDISVECKKDDSIAQNKYPSQANLGAWGNMLFGGIIGYAIDYSTGAGFDYPQSIVLVLNPCPISK